MFFNSLTFLGFYAALYIIVWAGKCSNYRKAILLVASYVFYGWWDFRFLSLIWISTGVDYILGLLLEKEERPGRRKFYLVVSLVSNLGILGFFKYYDFFIESANPFFGYLGFSVSTLNVLLPVGISFYTFQTLSYTIDVYRRHMPATRSLLDFALFIGFFPQLVAGPIVRAVDFLPQLRRSVRLTTTNFNVGFQIFLFGLVKKVVFADNLGVYVDTVYGAPDVFNSPTLVCATMAYALQIYFDFSGYSDMAIGLARTFGFSLPRNFNMPYVAQNIAEFWHRWHISLSTWLRDYLYIPLGGNRLGEARTCVNLMITMLLGGLWHGASANFVVWGAFHGGALVIHRHFTKFNTFDGSALAGFVGWITTLGAVLFGWVFFRQQDVGLAFHMCGKMLAFSVTNGVHWIYTPFVLVLAATVLGHLWGLFRSSNYLVMDLSRTSGLAVVWFVVMGIFFLAPTNANPFIYFQF